VRRLQGLFLLAVCAVGCNTVADPNDVPGTYVMNLGKARDTLTVYPDSSYRRVYVSPGARAVVDIGRWGVRRVDNKTFIDFSDFTTRWRVETFPGDPPKTGTWSVAAERNVNDDLLLGVDDDMGWAYIQLKRND
jgi:hypothetical protein